MLRITLCLRNLWYYRTMGSIVEELLKLGHFVEICIIGNDPHGGTEIEHTTALSEIETLTVRYDNRLSLVRVDRDTGSFAMLSFLLGQLIDFFHFRLPYFEEKTSLRRRVKGPLPLRRFLARPLFQKTSFAKIARPFLAWLERALPGDLLYRRHFLRSQPDIVLFSPLIDLGLPQFSQLRAAQDVKCRTAIIVNSWDNLSSKAWLRKSNCQLIVWNQIQETEAQQIHEVPETSVHITGAPVYDKVFSFNPCEDRETFMLRLGLDPNNALVVYVASATFDYKKNSEPEFVLEWLEQLRAHPDPKVANAAVLIRPHPKRRLLWQETDMALPRDTIIWPPIAVNPVDESSREDYFTTLANADAIVGLNTSAFLEGAILKRPVLAITPKKFAHSQAQTHHFHYLINGGLLRADSSIPEHLDRLGETLASPQQSQKEAEFIQYFTRPVSLERPAAEISAKRVEELARTSIATRRMGISAYAVRYMVLAPAAFALAAIVNSNPKMDPFKRFALKTSKVNRIKSRNDGKF